MTRRETIAAIIDHLAVLGLDFEGRRAFYVRVAGKETLAAMDAGELGRVLDEAARERHS